MNVFFLNTWLAVYYENQLTDRLKSRALQCLQDVDDPAGVFQKVCQASLTDEILSDDAGPDSTAAQNIIRR